MSNSPPNSKNAAPAQVASDYKKIKRIPPVWRANSTSLLTQALTSSTEEGRQGAVVSTSPRASKHSSSSAYTQNGLNNSADGSAGEKMKVVASGLRDMSLFDQRSTPTPTNYRELLNSSRIRGTSLERTVQEKRVQERPKGTYSTNPGDTALPPNFSHSQSSTALGHGPISNKTPTEGPRAQYRQWRGSRPNTPNSGSGKAWSIGVDGDDGGQVEKAVRAALAGDMRPSNRSRKASHALGFFKESLHKTDSKTPSSKDHAAKSGQDSYSRDSEADSGERRMKALPKALLAEIRKHSNITPGAAKGSSFSRSVPQMLSERRASDGNADGSDKSAENYHPENDDSNDDSHDISPLKIDGEEPEEEEQQIFFASALFVPHQPFSDSSAREENRSQSTTKPGLSDGRPLATSNSHQWLEEYEVPTSHVNRKYVREEETTGSGLFPDNGTFETQHTSNRDLNKDQLSSFGDEVDTVTDNERTPTGSPTGTDGFSSNYNRYVPEDDPSYMPPDAIELVPYRHQVGGHTKIWRFSARAVCKKLDKRENAFYENVERYHPELLDFLPRYIGVINIFYKTLTKSKSKGAGTEAVAIINEDGKSSLATIATNEAPSQAQPQHTRIISQSLEAAPEAVPTVTFADNRHLLPQYFMQPHSIPHQVVSNTKGSTFSKHGSSPKQSMPPPPHSDFRPTLSDKHSASWGTTIANSELRDKTFFDILHQQPSVQRHKKPGSHKRSLPTRNRISTLRASNSESSLQTSQQGQSVPPVVFGEDSIRKKAMVANAEQRHSPPKSQSQAQAQALVLSRADPDTNVDTDAQHNGNSPHSDEDDPEFSEKAGTSAPDPVMAHSHTTTRQRRYSSGGLRRKPSEVADTRGDLKYFEEADDAGYKGDNEEDEHVFNMDPELGGEHASTASGPTVADNRIPALEGTNGSGTMLPAPIQSSSFGTIDPNAPRPLNPKEARTQWGKLYHYFIVMEDLTCGMKKPSMMDLKMGTRQYSTAANEKKQKSQRGKSAKSTSKSLGVRICGMQVWDVKDQDFVFLDKYRGRNLKVGGEFQDALTRFLWDGVDNNSILRHIPPILEKLSRLEECVRGLRGYRFYGTSLLMCYDGDAQAAWESDSGASERDSSKADIDFRIADFANGVIGDTLHPEDLQCPPQHPDLPDNGFLRGLRSLRRYFMKIQREYHAIEMGKSLEGEDEVGSSTGEDEGAVSY